MNPHQPIDSSPYQSPQEQGAPEEALPSRPKLPLALKVVAWLTIGQGALAVIEAISQLTVNFGILWIPAGFGLLKLRPRWRTLTLALIWLMMIAFLFVALVAPFVPEPQELEIPGFKTVHVPNWVLAVGAVFFFLLFLWQYRVLIRRDVKALFRIHGENVPLPDKR